jgi:outer membrane beta-barrel protein
VARLKRTVFVFGIALAQATLFGLPESFAADAGAAGADAKDTDAESTREERLEDRTRRLGDRIKSVQRKVFLKRLRHELSVMGGLSINDAFFQMFSLGGGYAFHISEHFALEASAKYYFNPIRLNAVRVVRETENATPIAYFAPQLTISADLQFAPIYGKMSLMAEKIIHYDVYIAAGFGAAMTDNPATPWHPMGSAAIGARIMATDWLTVRLEVRDQIYQDTRSSVVSSVIQNLVTFNLGVSFFLPPTFDYRFE